MSGTKNHPWCRDVRRDEAIRAAEDAAAAERTPVPDHRDLPAAVAELRERVARLEAEIPKSVSGSNAEAHKYKGDTMPSDGLLTERVTLEITMLEGGREYHGDVSSWDWKAILSHGKNFFSFGESVRVVEEERELADNVPKVVQIIEARDALADDVRRLTSDLAKERDTVAMLQRRYQRCVDLRDKDAITIADLTAERDAAIRERDAHKEEYYKLRGERITQALTADRFASVVAEADRLRARVAELEAAPAANAGGEARQEPVLHGVLWADRLRIESHDVRDTCEQAARLAGADGTVVPLYAAPQRPRGWLKEEERKCLKFLLDNVCVSHETDECIKALLARSTPPKVKVPSQPAEFTLRAWNLCVSRWIAAIRAAGGEVEE